MKPCSVFIFAVSFAVLITPLAAAQGNVYYISINDPNCDDNGNGTSAVPWCNLSRAYTWYAGAGPKVQEGDVVLFRDGDYGEFEESTYKGIQYYFHRTDWITYKADAGHKPILTNIFIRNRNVSSGEDGESYLIFDGFTIGEDFNETTGSVSITYTSYVKILNSNITHKPNSITGYYAPYWNAGDDCIGGSFVSNIFIENNEISRCVRGIDVTDGGSNWVIKNNNVSYCSADNIALGVASGVTVDGNYLYDIRRFTTVMAIYGTKTGDFYSGDIIEMPGTDAIGVVYDWTEATNKLRVFVTSENTFHEYHEANNSLTISDTISGATLDPVTLVDPAHTDGFQIDPGPNQVLNNFVFVNNYIDRRNSYGIGSENGQGVKIVGRVGTDFSNLTIENNVIDCGSQGSAGVPILFHAVRDVKFNNNTLLGAGGSLFGRSTLVNNLIIDEMYNNIIEYLLIRETEVGGFFVNVKSHNNNIFGNNPNGTGGDYPFVLNSSEFVNVDIDSLFVDVDSDLHPILSGLACNGSVNDYGVAVGALSCTNQCENGEVRLCSRQNGVCENSSETCTNNVWPGCDYFSIQGYELIEESCLDFEDNDCDSNVDDDDFDCSFAGPEGVVSYWKFEDNLYDETQNNDGTGIGNPEYISGVSGQAIQFNGANYIDVGTMGDFGSQVADNYTVLFWIKTNSSNKSSVYGTRDSGSVVQIMFYTNYAFDKVETSGYVYAQVGGSEGGTRFPGDSPNINNNEWHHIAVVHSPSAGSLKIYNNATLLTTYVRTTLVPSTFDFENPLLIGANNDRYGSAELFFNGTIDEVMVYNRALNLTEIQEIYNAQKPSLATGAATGGAPGFELNIITLIITVILASAVLIAANDSWARG